MSRLTKGVLYLTGLVVVGLVSFYGGKLSVKPHTVSELSPIFIYDKEDLLELSIEDMGKYHGDVCPCVAVAFRATQLAISKLWDEEIPRRRDFRIITRCPTQGTQDVFEFITRAKTGKNREGDFRIELTEGTSFEDLSADNFAFIFIRKSTGDSLEVKVKKEIFTEGFFELRKKVKSGKATRKEIEVFENAKDELKHRYLNLSADEVFVFNGE